MMKSQNSAIGRSHVVWLDVVRFVAMFTVVCCHSAAEGYLILPILSDETAVRLTRFLVENRLGILRLEERQKSLEDIFLELTGKAASL